MSRPSASPEPLVGRVRDLSHRGEAVVETASGVVFGPPALLGERVELRSVRRARRALRAGRLRVLEPSPERRAPACPLAARCGGCPLMIASEAAQLEIKARRVARALRRVWSGPVEVRSPEARLGYRARARLAFDGDRIGYRRANGRAVVDAPLCPVLAPDLQAALDGLRRALRLGGRGELRLARGRGAPVASVAAERPQSAGLFTALGELVAAGTLAGATLATGGGEGASWGDPREWSAGVDGAPLVGTPRGFSQAHPELNLALARRVVEVAAPGGARVTELHAGCGNLTIALAPLAGALRAAERDRASAEACRANLAARGLLARARVAAVDAREAAGWPADLVVMDPPRTGALEAVRALLSHPRPPPRIVYVSCDPETLGRDCAALLAGGYALDHIEAFDMFPQTAHVEALALLQR